MIEQVRIANATTDVEKLTYTQNARETRESAQIVLTNARAKRYEMYTKVELLNEEGTATLQYIVQADQVVQESDDYYRHTVALIEPITYLDTVIPASRSFTTRTGEQLTIQDILDVYIREIGFYNHIDIDYEQGAWLDKKVTQKEYDGQKFSSILTNLFNTIKANPKGYFDTSGTLILYPQFNKTRNTLIDGESDSYYIAQNSMNYATKAKVQAKNAVYESLQLDWFPSANGFILPRTSSYVMRESELQYELDSGNLGIKKVEVMNFDYEEIWFEDGSERTQIYDGYPVDITNQVVTQEEWEALDTESLYDGKYIETDDMRENHVRYDIGENVIYGLYESSGGLLDTDIKFLENAIRRNLEPKNSDLHDPNAPQPIQFNILSPSGESPIKSIGLRIQYVKQRDIDYTVNRLNSTGKTASQMLYSQTASRVNLQKQKDNVGVLANRLGNDVEYRNKFFAPDEYLWKVFDYKSDGKVIVDAKYTQYATGVYGEFELSENFANVDADTSIAREPSPYTITGKKFQTNVIEENYMLFSESQVVNDTILTQQGIAVTRSFLDNAPLEKSNHAIFTNPQGQNLHMSLVQGGGGYTSTFHVAWRRPIIAGWRIDEIDGAELKQPVVYTEPSPTFNLENFRLYLTSSGVVEDDGTYPIVNETAFATGALTENTYRPIDLGLNDSFAYTFALHAIKNSENIIIGQRIMETFPLHNNEARSFTLYYSETKFNQMDTELRAGDFQVFGGEIIVTKSEQKIEVTGDQPFENWAIVDNSGEIVLAANGIKTVYFGFVDRDLSGGTQEIETFYYDIAHDLSISVNATYTTKKLRNIDVAVPPQELGIDVHVDYLARKLNSVSVAANQDMSITVSATYNTTKPRNISVAPSQSLGIDTNVTYNAIKPIYLSVNATQGLGIDVTATYNKVVQATSWDYIGTSANEDNSVQAGSDGTTCRSSSELETWINNNVDASNYQTGYIMRVDHARLGDGSLEPCQPYYYEAV